MPVPTFDAFFSAATTPPTERAAGEPRRPYDYQRRLACGDRAGRDDATWLASGRPCASLLIDIPTGLGKTAAVVLAWLWNRVALEREDWPRRLVYCLPMRTLVEQTRDEVAKWLDKMLDQNGSGSLPLSESALAQLLWLRDHSPVILMGGEENESARREWDIHPERPAILIGTQDMLLSRALNRGYGMARARWPMHFGLLNHDALWVMDETQLMGVGIETSSQLDAFRHALSHPTFSPGTPPTPSPHFSAFTWWMSATLEDTRLSTVDQPPARVWPRIALASDDLALSAVRRRIGHDPAIAKPLAPAPVTLASASEKEAQAYARCLAALIQERHATLVRESPGPGTLTLVVLNRVDRARAVYEALAALGVSPAQLALVHSRFRPEDRQRHQEKLLDRGIDRIVVATQAVEAGVDVSARLLITELAPWSSLVQRFGRCNRYGEHADASVIWIDLAFADDRDTAPYTASELGASRAALRALTDVTSRSLAAIRLVPPPVVRPVLRRKDLLDLFDTTPDLAGHDLDVARYIRDGDDTDVQVFWRDLGGEPPAEDPAQPAPTRAELCRVSFGRFADFLEKLRKRDMSAYTWNTLDERWERFRSARPRAGATYLLDTRAGGYTTTLGWTGEPGDAADPATWTTLPPPALRGDAPPDANGRDPQTFLRDWLSLADHTRDVVTATDALATALALPPALAAPLHTAALWHDLGKAHLTFQNALKAELPPHAEPPPDPTAFYAKSKNPPRRYRPPASRGQFRHELASALAWLLAGPPATPERDLVAYLIAAHHGKVRLSLRSLPGEALPAGLPPETRLARGIIEGDELPAAAFGLIGAPPRTEPLRLMLGLMELGSDPATGEPSWLARTLALRDRLGPFRLAWLETLLRAADSRASAASTLPATT